MVAGEGCNIHNLYMYLSTCISISQENCLAISKSQGTPLYGLHRYVQPQPSLRRTAWPSPSHRVLPYMGYIGMCNPNHLSGEPPGHLQSRGTPLYGLHWYVQPQPSLGRTAWPSPSHGVLPNMGYMGMCNPKGYGFQLC